MAGELEKYLFFEKNASNIPVDNGSSLNVTIAIKISALVNITIIETSILSLYQLVHSLIFNLPLLFTSSWRFEIACHPHTSLYKFPQMTKFNQKKMSLLTIRISIFRLISLY